MMEQKVDANYFGKDEWEQCEANSEPQKSSPRLRAVQTRLVVGHKEGDRWGEAVQRQRASGRAEERRNLRRSSGHGGLLWLQQRP